MNWYNARHRAGDAMSARPAARWLRRCASACSRRRSTSSITLRLPLRRLAHLAAAGRLAAARRDWRGTIARRLHQRRRLLGVRARALRPVHVRPVSRARALARRSRRACCWVRGVAALSWRGLPRRRASAIAALRRPAAARHLAAHGGCGPAARRDARMGRADADALPHDLCRPDRHPARHPAGARPPLAPAADPLRLGRVHRVLARRADHHRDLPRLAAAAADHADRLRRRPPGARRDRARLRDRRLHGRSRARRPAGAARRPGRGRAGAGPGLLAHPRG